MNKKFCVYAHLLDGVVKYIGEGTRERAYRKSRSNHKNWHDSFHGKDFDVLILEENLTKEESSKLELVYINKHSDTIINSKKTSIRPIYISYDEVSKSVYYDETSPTCLRWVTGNKKFNAGDVAGYFSKSSGYADITINNILYRVHRIVWVLLNKELSQNVSIDHISGDKKDNRISNLRLATSSDNNKNRLQDVPSTGLRNIRVSNGKSGLSSFEVIWRDNNKQHQETFNIKKLGSIQKALECAYDFRNSLIETGKLTHRLKDGEKSLKEVLDCFANSVTSSTCVRTIPKSGMRMIDLNFYKGEFYRFVVRYPDNYGKITSKTFKVKTTKLSALEEAYAFRESLINLGKIDKRVKDGELTFKEVLEIVEKLGDK